MKYTDINKRYTEIVSKYIAKGYTINSATMGGSQGQVANVDLTNGNEIIRVLIEHFNEYYNDDGCSSFEGVDMIVGVADLSGGVFPNNDSTWGTIWNDRLQILRKERFYQVGESCRGTKFYGNREEARFAQIVRTVRRKNRQVANGFVPTEEMMDVAYNVVKTKLNFKCPIRSAIMLVKRDDGKYAVYYRDKVYQLH